MCFCFYVGTTFYCNTRWFWFIYLFFFYFERRRKKSLQNSPKDFLSVIVNTSAIIMDRIMQAANERCTPTVSYFTCSSIVPRRRLTENDDRNYRNLVLTMGFFMYRWVYDSADNLKTARNHAEYTYQFLFLVIFMSAWRKSIRVVAQKACFAWNLFLCRQLGLISNPRRHLFSSINLINASSHW